MLGWQAGVYMARMLEKRKYWSGATRIYKGLIAAGEARNSNLNFRLGHAYYSANDLVNAEIFISKAIELDPSKSSWHYRLGFINEKSKRYDEAIESYRHCLVLEGNQPLYWYRIAKSQAQLQDVESAAENFCKAASLAPTEARYTNALIKYLAKHIPAWQQIEIFNELLAGKDDVYEIRFALGKAKQSLERFADALVDFRKCHDIYPTNVDAAYLCGHMSTLISQPDKAAEYFKTALDNVSDSAKMRLGAGYIAESQGDWQSAEYYYRLSVSENPLFAELHYRLGLALDRNYNWEAAEESLRMALSLEGGKSSWHYRLGFVLERQEKWAASAQAYGSAVEMSESPLPYWYYRLGKSLMKTGDFERSANSFLLMNRSIANPEAWMKQQKSIIPTDGDSEKIALDYLSLCTMQDAEMLFDHSRRAARVGEWRSAAVALRFAIDISKDHKPGWYQQCGEYHLITGDFENATKFFAEQRIFQRADGIDPSTYFTSKSRRQTMEYVEFLEESPILDNTILYESHFGNSLDCNPLAICEAALADDTYGSFTHIWVINDRERIPLQLKGLENVFFIPRNSDAYRKYLATSKFLVNNVSFPTYFVRRQGQEYLNTWHGTPLKTLGVDIQTGFMEHANVSRNFLQATHIQAANAHTERVLIQKYDIDGISSAKVIREGTPRIDRVLSQDELAKDALRVKLGIPIDSSLPVVLYAPTWRGSLTEKHFDDNRLISDLEAMASAGTHFLFRAHHMTENLLMEHDLSEYLVPRDIDTNDLLSIVDVLITDYSSIFFDFLPTRKEIIYYAYDLEEYKEERGLYFEMSDMPGSLCESIDEVVLRIQISQNVVYVPNHKYRAAIDAYCSDEDGHSAARVLNAFVNIAGENDAVALSDDKHTILFHQSLMPNGITSSFINLVSSLDPLKYRVIFLFDPKSISGDTARWENFDRLPEHVQKIARVGGMNRSLEEQWIADRVDKYYEFFSSEAESIYQNMFAREACRLFGRSAQIENVIEFDGYSPFWLALLGSVNVSNRRIAYLHNDMISERSSKYSYLSLSFMLYDYFHRIVSVSVETHEINSHALTAIVGIPADKFDYCDNVIDIDDIIVKSNDLVDLSLLEWLDNTENYFLNIGRLSPEKDQEKLILAFQHLIESGLDVKLVILGDGPLRQQLQSLIERWQLQDRVLLAGRISNPFPLMKAARAFVLSSNHEGQPMVLLEAMSVGTSVIATDIPANRGVVNLGYGSLVENSQQGLIRGMEDILLNSSENMTFSADAYISGAILQFENLVSGSDERNIDKFSV